MADALDEAMQTERFRLQARLGLPFPGLTMWVSEEMQGLRFDVLLNDVPQKCVEVPAGLMLLLDPASPLAANAQRHGPVLEHAESLWVKREQVKDEDRAASGVVVDISRKRLVLDNQTVALTYKEFELLQYLVLREGRTIERSELIASLWSSADEEDVHLEGIALWHMPGD